MSRLIAKIVFSGLVTAWRLAGCPTRISPALAKATIEGVVRTPSAFSITLAWRPSMTATQELVVPRSMPITFGAIAISPSRAHIGFSFARTYRGIEHGVWTRCLDSRQFVDPPTAAWLVSTGEHCREVSAPRGR